MIFAAVVAGGVGNRMNLSGMPKQFLPLGKSKKPIIIHTLEKFVLCEKFDYIYVGVHKEWIDYTEELLKKYSLADKRIVLVEGGKDRNLTILNIINAIESNHGKSEEHIIVTHDAVRPFVTLRMIEENINTLNYCGACDTVIPAVDTIIESKKGKIIDAVPKRNSMYLGQTPQSFRMSQFKELFSQLSDDEKSILTDACSVFICKGKEVQLVREDAFNIKITTVSDYKIADALLGGDISD